MNTSHSQLLSFGWWTINHDRNWIIVITNIVQNHYYTLLQKVFQSKKLQLNAHQIRKWWLIIIIVGFGISAIPANSTSTLKAHTKGEWMHFKISQIPYWKEAYPTYILSYMHWPSGCVTVSWCTNSITLTMPNNKNKKQYGTTARINYKI